MKLFRSVLSASVLVSVLALAPAARASDEAVLKVDNIPGEVVERGFENQIAIKSFSFGVTPGGGARQFTITKGVDKSSPLLMQAAATSQPGRTIVMSLRKATAVGRVLYYKVTLERAVVSSVKTGGDGAQTTEEVAFTYARITVEYTPTMPNGAPGATVKWTG
jgi:type VI secretion system Hcp family effector